MTHRPHLADRHVLFGQQYLLKQLKLVAIIYTQQTFK